MSSVRQSTVPRRSNGDNPYDLPPRCFICYCWRENETSSTSLKPLSALNKNLFVVFVLQKLFDLPSENVCHYLEKAGEPADWIWFCKSCTSKIEDAKGIHKQLLWLEGWFRRVKGKLMDDIKDSVVHRPVDRKRKPAIQANMKLTDELRKIVLKHQTEVDGVETVQHTPSVSIAKGSGFGDINGHFLERSRQRMKMGAVRSCANADLIEKKGSNQFFDVLSYSQEDSPDIKCEQLSPTSPVCVSDDDDEDLDYYHSPLDPDNSGYSQSDSRNHATEAGPYQCEVKDCDFEFQATKDFRIHLFKEHGRFINKRRNRPLEVYEIEKCTVCDLNFPAYSFELHMKICHSSPPNTGNETENDTSTMDYTLDSNAESTQRLWLKPEGNRDNFECSICLKKQINQELLDEHLRLHKSSPYHCFVCLSFLKDGNTLYNHICRCHPEYKSSFNSIKATKPKEPGSVKVNKTKEPGGVKVNKPTKNVKCSKCIRFLPPEQMPEHMELHEKSPYHCSLCRTVYIDKKNLYNHYTKYHHDEQVEMDKIRIRLGIKKNKKRSFSKKSKSSPKSPNIKAKKKTEKCSKCTRYIPFSEMPEHMELHETSPYSCHYCGNVFNDKHNLFKHYLKYHNEDKMTLDKLRIELGIKKQMKSRIDSQTKHGLENEATIKRESESNENEGETEPMDDNDEEWKPHQKKRRVTPSVRQKSTERQKDNRSVGLRKLTDQNRKMIKCPLCVKFECYIDNRENLCEHLELCKGYGENINEDFIGLEQFCPVCNNFKCSFAEKSNFIEHLMMCRGANSESSGTKVPSYERIYKCNICPTTKYLNLNAFLAHFLFHKKNIYKCCKCPRRFLLTCSVHIHWKSHHQESMKVHHSRRFITDFAVPEVPWWCSVCNERFPNEEIRDLHLQTMHDQEVPKTHVCQQCSNGFSCPEELKLHQGTSHVAAKRPFICQICQESFVTATLRRLHMEDTHGLSGRSGPERFVCDICGIECRTMGSFRMHLQLHQEVRNYACDECDRSFTSRQYLRFHKFRDHVPADDKINPSTCSICKKTFHSKHYLNKHIMSVHEKKYTFFCDKCGNGYLYMSRLKRHLMIHHGVGEHNKHMCRIDGCNKSYWSKTAFKSHMCRHRNEPQYKCSFCGKEFYSSSHCRRHENIHINRESKPYQCEICNKRFPVQNYLYIHMRSHNKKKQENAETK